MYFLESMVPCSGACVVSVQMLYMSSLSMFQLSYESIEGLTNVNIEHICSVVLFIFLTCSSDN